jgi:hypothetical protein
MMNPNQNPYDFLNSSPQRGLNAVSQKTRIIQVAVGLAILLVLFIVFMSVLSSSSDGPKKALLELNAAQSDLIELTALADTKARDGALRSQAAMINQTVKTHSAGTLALLQQYGGSKKPDKEVAPYRDTMFKDQLTKAETANTFDTTYREILSARLGEYRGKLNNAYGAITAAAPQKELSDYYRQVEILAPSSAQ